MCNYWKDPLALNVRTKLFEIKLRQILAMPINYIEMPKNAVFFNLLKRTVFGRYNIMLHNYVRRFFCISFQTIRNKING